MKFSPGDIHSLIIVCFTLLCRSFINQVHELVKFRSNDNLRTAVTLLAQFRIIADIVHKYRDISLGRVIMMCDIVIISSSYLVFHNFEQVIYGYVVLLITAYCIDQVVNVLHRSVQFFIISDKYQEIASRIAVFPHRGATVIEAYGFYTGHEVKMLFIMAKRRESTTIFRIINEIDPKAFVTETNVIGVYGEGFDKFKVKMPRKHERPIPAEKLAEL
ncbi:hypothetical protein LPYR103PRE_07680 [Segatella asaccharophila]